MATSSIFTNVRIEDASKAEVFVNALEKAAANMENASLPASRLPLDERKIYDSFIKSVRRR